MPFLESKMRAVCKLLVLTELLFVSTISLAFSSPNDAYPTGYGDEPGSCVGASDDLRPLRREVYEDGQIFDITHQFNPNTPMGDSDEGIGQFLTLLSSMKNGSDYNFSELRLGVHAGTHVDAPGHMYEDYFDAGFDVDSLDLRVLNGPALLVDVPRDKNLTADAMQSLHIPKGVKRVLFRTLNTDSEIVGSFFMRHCFDLCFCLSLLIVNNIGVSPEFTDSSKSSRRLMWKKAFDTSYVGFMKDGAQWLVDNTDIKLVGIDYLSVAAFDDLLPAHHVFLKSREIILVEGLKLDDIEAGLYTVHCLPLRLLGAEGSPIRCILIK
uniref:Uncharacterized protein n=1 Tax=Solanum lycopersicum TaxID=4081 RepID=A0A3Q7ES58_SOLLC